MLDEFPRRKIRSRMEVPGGAVLLQQLLEESFAPSCTGRGHFLGRQRQLVAHLPGNLPSHLLADGRVEEGAALQKCFDELKLVVAQKAQIIFLARLRRDIPPVRMDLLE